MTAVVTFQLREDSGAAVPAADRGATEVAERVVAKIAAAAVGEVEHARGAARRVAGVALGSDEAADRPHADATVDGHTATVDVTMSVVYPAPVADVATVARAAVINRVGQLCGITVRQVDIHVTALVPPRATGRRVQ